MVSEIKVDTVSEKTSGSGVTIDGLLIKDGGISGDVSLIGTTPTFTIGDAGAEDAALVFDGNAQDFYIALDDSADDLVIGKGSAVGTTPAVSIDENLQVIVHDNLSLLSDSSVLKFGTDGDTTLTHTDGTGLTLNSTNKLCFNDASQYIQGASATVLDIAATDEIELNATLVDINANVEISGTATTTGVHTFSAAPVFPDGSIAVADLDIDGATDIGAAIVDADLFIIDDGAGGTNRKTTAARLKTYIGSFNADAAQVFNESSADVDFRVESNNNINTIMADGGQAAVGINCVPTVFSAEGGSELSTSVYGLQATCAATGSGRVAIGANGTNNAYVTGAHPNANGNVITLSRLEFEQTSNTAGSEAAILELYTATGGTGVLRFAIAANGDLTATDTSIAAISDSRVKKNIADYTYDVAKFKQLQPRTFDFKNPVQHNGTDNNRGFIAQEVQAVDDYWVSEKKLKPDNLDYDLMPDNKLALTSKLGKKDAMYISVINQLIARIEALEA